MFSLRNPQCNKFNMDFYLLSWTVIEHHRIFISIWSCPLFLQKPKRADWLMYFRLLQWIFMRHFWSVCRNLMGSYEYVLWWCGLVCNRNEFRFTTGLTIQKLIQRTTHAKFIINCSGICGALPTFIMNMSGLKGASKKPSTLAGSNPP